MSNWRGRDPNGYTRSSRSSFAKADTATRRRRRCQDACRRGTQPLHSCRSLLSASVWRCEEGPVDRGAQCAGQIRLRDHMTKGKPACRINQELVGHEKSEARADSAEPIQSLLSRRCHCRARRAEDTLRNKESRAGCHAIRGAPSRKSLLSLLITVREVRLKPCDQPRRELPIPAHHKSDMRTARIRLEGGRNGADSAGAGNPEYSHREKQKRMLARRIQKW